jgi:hypothetical protein
MREVLAELHHRAWLAAGLAGVLVASFAFLHCALPAALTAMAAGGLLMSISEEENRVVAAMVPANAPMPAVIVPTSQSAVSVRDWASPFPARRPTRWRGPQERRAHGRRRRVGARGLSD